MAGVLTYLNTLQCGIVFDDNAAIKTNQDLLPDTPWVNLFTHDFWGADITDASSHKSYRPLCVATFRLNYLLHGLEPMGYHLVNVVLHGVVCLLYATMCALVSRSVWQSLVAGLLFAVHPIHTEAVRALVCIGCCGDLVLCMHAGSWAGGQDRAALCHLLHYGLPCLS